MDYRAVIIRLGQKGFAFMELTRISVIFMGLPFAMAGAAYALSITHLSISVLQGIMGVIAVFFVTGAVHTIDDYFDRERDRHLWPDRQIPSGGTNSKAALITAVCCYGVGFALVSIFYNVFSLIVLIIAALLA
ncbi:MAG: UbiA family prenyltransferase, partial [Candidatus Helarchaeota archaeon]